MEISQLPSRLKLASRRDVEWRVQVLLNFYRELLGEAIFLGEKVYDPRGLVLTQNYIESDKLALVLKATLFEGYYAPIIVVVGKGDLRYVVDGHHRTLVHAWLKRRVSGYTLLVPRYEPRVVRSILDVDTVNPSDTPEHLSCWRHMVNTIRFFEKRYGVLAEVWFEKLGADKLRPTEPFPTRGPSLFAKPPECPILVYKLNEEYYVVDGHHRVCSSIASGEKQVPSLVFTLNNQELGLVKTAKKLGLTHFTRAYCYESLP